MKNKNDLKLYLSLIGWALVPSIYLLVKMHIIAINEVDINVLGQLEWFDLIDEIMVTILTVPFYYLLKPEKANAYKNGTMFLTSLVIYCVLLAIVICYIKQITTFMNADYALLYLV